MVQMKIEKIVRVFANVSPIFAAIKNRAARTTIAPYPRNIWSALMLLRHGDFRRERVSIREKDRPELQTDQRMIVGAVSSPHIESNFVGIPIGPLAVFVRHWLALGVQNPATCANANLPARSLVPEQNIVIVGFLSLLTLKLLGLRQIHDRIRRSEEHTSELQSLMRISYAVFCLKKKKIDNNKTHSEQNII